LDAQLIKCIKEKEYVFKETGVQGFCHCLLSCLLLLYWEPKALAYAWFVASVQYGFSDVNYSLGLL
jgi:hypothetical protein